MMMTSSMIFNLFIILISAVVIQSVVEYIVGMILFAFDSVGITTLYISSSLAGYFSLFCWGWYQSANLFAIFNAFGRFLVQITA